MIHRLPTTREGHKQLVQCPLYGKAVNIRDPKGCLLLCPYCEGTEGGQIIMCSFEKNKGEKQCHRGNRIR